MPALFSRHPLALQTAYAEVKRLGLEQPFVLYGSPGSVDVREVKSRRFYYRTFYDAEGRKAAEYIGAVGDPTAEAKSAEVRARIAETGAIGKEVRLLAQSGYVKTDARTIAILAAVANHGIFRAGALLVGSHAYGALLNDLGARAAAFATEDIDLARSEPLEITGTALETVLAESGVPLLPVFGFAKDAPAISYKAKGRDRLRVDLLVPGRGAEIAIRKVPELDAHAQALPHLGYLLERSLEGVVLARDNVVAVRVPRPEAYCFHKMWVSQSRGATNEKRGKDLHQAAVVFAVLAEDAPDTLGAAFSDLPRGTRSATVAAAAQVETRLREAGHTRAVDTLRAIARR